MTIEVKHQVPTTVYTTEIKLPYYFQSGKYVKHYNCMTEAGNLISVSQQGGYYHIDVRPNEDSDEITNALEREFCDVHFAVIDEAVFHHEYSKAQRDIYYLLHPALKP